MNNIMGTLLGEIIIGVCIAAVIIYIKWCFIRSAVESGTLRAIEKILHDYTDLIEDITIETQNNNDHEEINIT